MGSRLTNPLAIRQIFDLIIPEEAEHLCVSPRTEYRWQRDGWLQIQSAGKYHYYKEVSRERVLDCAMAAKAIKIDGAHEQVLQILGSIQSPAEWQGEIQRMTQDLDHLQQMQNRKVAFDEQLRRLSRAMVDGGISENKYERKRAPCRRRSTR